MGAGYGCTRQDDPQVWHCSVCVLNGGIVIKEAANQHYCTDAFSRAVFQAICDVDEFVAKVTEEIKTRA